MLSNLPSGLSPGWAHRFAQSQGSGVEQKEQSLSSVRRPLSSPGSATYCLVLWGKSLNLPEPTYENCLTGKAVVVCISDLVELHLYSNSNKSSSESKGTSMLL